MRTLFPACSVMAIAFCIVVVEPVVLRSQMWTPAGQMVGPLMWPFPLTLPDSTHLIPLRWVNARGNDSLYWFDVESFLAAPEKYKRQQPNLKSINDVGDYDSDGRQDIIGGTYSGTGLTVFSAFSDTERIRAHEDGMLYVASGVETRFLGDLDGDGLNDGYSWDGYSSPNIVYGHFNDPFIGLSFVAIRDSRNSMYPDLPPAEVVALGTLDGIPCLVQVYYSNPQEKYYELLELNREDLSARKDTIRTTVNQRAYLPGHNYGAVVLRTPGVWWLFGVDPNGSRDRGLKVSRSGMSVVTVPEYWRAYWDRYLGQGGENSESNFPRVIDADRPFIRYDRPTNIIDSVGEVRYAALTLTRLKDPSTAEVEILGTAVPIKSQMLGSYLMACSVVDDIDNDGLHDMMVNYSYKPVGATEELSSVNLYLTSQRPTVSVEMLEQNNTGHIKVIDLVTAWRLVEGCSCTQAEQPLVQLFDVAGSRYNSAHVRIDGRDLLIEKPKDAPTVLLWVRVGECTVRLQ